MAFGQAVYGLVVLIVVMWYSTMVWKMTDEYFHDEFKSHLIKYNDKNTPKFVEKRIYNNIQKGESDISQHLKTNYYKPDECRFSLLDERDDGQYCNIKYKV